MRNFARASMERLAQRVAIGRVFTDAQPEPTPEPGIDEEETDATP